MPEVKILVFADDADKKPRLYACGKCGTAHSPKLYLAKDDVANAAAFEAAENCWTCKTGDICNQCGCETRKGCKTCSGCKTAKRLESAIEVQDDGGPYCVFDGDTYYTELDQAIDDGVEWVSPCDISYPQICGEGILDSLVSDMHEDAQIDDLVGADELLKAIARFNETQTAQTWLPDSTKKIRAPSKSKQ